MLPPFAQANESPETHLQVYTHRLRTFEQAARDAVRHIDHTRTTRSFLPPPLTIFLNLTATRPLTSEPAHALFPAPFHAEEWFLRSARTTLVSEGHLTCFALLLSHYFQATVPYALPFWEAHWSNATCISERETRHQHSPLPPNDVHARPLFPPTELLVIPLTPAEQRDRLLASIAATKAQNRRDQLRDLQELAASAGMTLMSSATMQDMMANAIAAAVASGALVQPPTATCRGEAAISPRRKEGEDDEEGEEGGDHAAGTGEDASL